jgi:hypothetical protein
MLERRTTTAWRWLEVGWLELRRLELRWLVRMAARGGEQAVSRR